MPEKNACAAGKRGAPERVVLGAERSLTILNAFLDGTNGYSLIDLARRTRLFKSVIIRYMISFERHGYVNKGADGIYRLGPRLFQLGKVYESTFDLSKQLSPLLRTLAERSGETASFYVREGEKRLCLLRVEGGQSVRVSVREGSLLPLDETSTSQVLRDFSEKRLSALAARETRWIRTSTGILEALTASASTPVFGVDNVLVGALTISGVSVRFRPEDDAVANMLVSAAFKISRTLGANLDVPARRSARRRKPKKCAVA
jgi:DNA-binding IclR family transcriptional regulator